MRAFDALQLRSLSLAAVLVCGIATQGYSAPVVFEAESYASMGGSNGFATVSSPAAAGGSYITTAGNATSLPSDATARYDLTFADVATYDLYARLYITTGMPPGTEDNFLNDSMYTPTDFGIAAANVINNTAAALGDEMWSWVNLTTGVGDQGTMTDGVGISYNVAAPGALSFEIAGREDGLLIDSFVLSDTALTTDDLNALTGIPEPGTAALLLIGLVGLFVRHARRS